MQRTVLLGAVLIGAFLMAAVAQAGVPVLHAALGPQAGMPVFHGQPTGISVTGEGKLTLAPDMATVQLGVQAQARTVEEARGMAAEAMERVVAALRAAGVAENDIKTSHFSIQPQKRTGPNGTVIDDGYRVTNMVTAKVRDVSAVGRVVDGSAAAGGNLVRVDSVQFGLQEPAGFQAQLRELAMNDARSRASELARLGSKGLGEPISIQEGAVPQPPQLLRSATASMAVQDTAFAPGEMEVRATVQVVWGIR